MRRGQAVTGSSSLVLLLLLLQVLLLRYRRHGGQSETPWSVRQRRARGQQQETKGQKALVDMDMEKTNTCDKSSDKENFCYHQWFDRNTKNVETSFLGVVSVSWNGRGIAYSRNAIASRRWEIPVNSKLRLWWQRENEREKFTNSFTHSLLDMPNILLQGSLNVLYVTTGDRPEDQSRKICIILWCEYQAVRVCLAMFVKGC